MRLILLLALNAVAVLLTGKLVPGITVKSYGAAFLAALLLAVANAIVRPILIFLTLPITLLTLGLFILVLNAVIFMVALKAVKGVEVEGCLAGFLGWIVYSALSWLIQAVILTPEAQASWSP